jgi:hypothetical protein
MQGGIFSLPLFPFTDANADERSKIDTSEEHSRDLHASHEEREREREREKKRKSIWCGKRERI